MEIQWAREGYLRRVKVEALAFAAENEGQKLEQERDAAVVNLTGPEAPGFCVCDRSSSQRKANPFAWRWQKQTMRAYCYRYSRLRRYRLAKDPVEGAVRCLIGQQRSYETEESGIPRGY